MADSTGMADLRAENVSKVVVGFALQEYRLKSLCMVQSSNSWKETYQKETATELTGGTGSTVKGIPRLANFPYGEVTWTEASSRLVKHGMDAVISWEDAKTNEIDVIARTLLRVARAVASSVDLDIYSAFTTDNGNTVATGAAWDAAVVADRDPIQDILNGIKLISIDNYDALGGSGFLLLNPTDYANLLGNANVRNAGQFYTDDVTRNGRVGKLLGLNVIVSNSVDADEAAIVIANEACTWKSAADLKVTSTEDAGVKWTIRAWEVGVAQVKNPNAICIITNTAA
ncbi:hypothetical protein CMI37_25010 [Candidatus Pacearchaeota archaeon]|nr:hypothetical protein [Candidatus Pacearchaeota archaeon]|tara:strand:- start:1108 stop:1965 length:858 start_codon:yes stop_codon:yes gene_type:complete